MRWLLPFCMLWAVSCTPKPDDLPPARENVRFEHVQPIFKNHCMQCHFGPTDWSNYDRAYPKRAQIYQRVVLWKTMPPGKPLTPEDRGLIRDWFQQGGKK